MSPADRHPADQPSAPDPDAAPAGRDGGLPPPQGEADDAGLPLPHREADTVITFDERLSLARIFTASESELAIRLLGYGRGLGNPQGDALIGALHQGFERLGALALALEVYPSVSEPTELAGQTRTRESLMQSLLDAQGHALEWTLPTKGVLARTYGIAKVNFWGAMAKVMDRFSGEERAALQVGIAEAVDEAVYTRLAEELYGSFVSSTETDMALKRRALDHTVDLWEGRVRLATHLFCPILRSAWAARMRAPRIFGTLMGTQEIVQLLFQDCDERFVDVFTRNTAAQGTIQAFEEFLFDLPWESLERVRAHMEAHELTCVGPDEVGQILSFPEKRLRPLMGGAKALYSSFRRRRVKAQYRTSMDVPGPRRTAESYVLEALLRAELDGDPENNA